MKRSKNKYLFGTVKIGANGEICLPAKALEVFGLKAGDELLLVGDTHKGLALVENKLPFSLMKED